MLRIIMIAVIDSNGCGYVRETQTTKKVSNSHLKQHRQRWSEDIDDEDNHNDYRNKSIKQGKFL